MKSIFIFLGICLSYLSPYAAENQDDSPPQKPLTACLMQKIQETSNNMAFVRTATNPHRKEVISTWAHFADCSVKQIEAAKNCPQKTLTIAGIDIKAHDISDNFYQFHIHTTAITKEKAKLLEQYILSQRTDGDRRIPSNQLNLDLCPLLSTSIIDPYTDGYTENCCNFGTDLQIHLILKADPRAISHMGPCDIYSPASKAIHKYLNNTQGRETMVDYLTRNLPTMLKTNGFYSIQSPQQLLIDTHTSPNSGFGFNEVVVCGNSYTHFFKESHDIEILGIGLSSYWLSRRPNPQSEDIEAFKNLGNIIPIVYYNPNFQKGLYKSILLGYLAKDKWLDALKGMYSNQEYSTVMLEQPRRSQPYRMEFQLPYYYFLCLDPVENYTSCKEEYKTFIEHYNHFIKTIYQENFPAPDHIFKSLQEMICSNLALGIKCLEIEKKAFISMHGNPQGLENWIADYHYLSKIFSGNQEALL